MSRGVDPALRRWKGMPGALAIVAGMEWLAGSTTTGLEPRIARRAELAAIHRTQDNGNSGTENAPLNYRENTAPLVRLLVPRTV